MKCVEEFSQFMANQPLIKILDIAIVWYLIYRLLLYARGSQVMNLLKGVGILIVMKFLSGALGLRTIDWLLGQVISWGVIAAIVLFQPEIRRALENLGKSLFRNRSMAKNPATKLIDDLETAIQYMSKRKIGALIVIEGSENIGEYIETGIRLNALISSQLLINIFIPNTPLHDGAVIIRNFRIAAASCFLPLSDNDTISKELGTRHRAAIGMSEVTDSLIIVISEETGGVSIAKNERLLRDMSLDQVRKYLETEYLSDAEDSEDDTDKGLLRTLKATFSDFFSRKDGSV